MYTKTQTINVYVCLTWSGKYNSGRDFACFASDKYNARRQAEVYLHDDEKILKILTYQEYRNQEIQ